MSNITATLTAWLQEMCNHTSVCLCVSFIFKYWIWKTRSWDDIVAKWFAPLLHSEEGGACVCVCVPTRVWAFEFQIRYGVSWDGWVRVRVRGRLIHYAYETHRDKSTSVCKWASDVCTLWWTGNSTSVCTHVSWLLIMRIKLPHMLFLLQKRKKSWFFSIISIKLKVI